MLLTCHRPLAPKKSFWPFFWLNPPSPPTCCLQCSETFCKMLERLIFIMSFSSPALPVYGPIFCALHSLTTLNELLWVISPFFLFRIFWAFLASLKKCLSNFFCCLLKRNYSNFLWPCNCSKYFIITTH